MFDAASGRHNGSLLLWVGGQPGAPAPPGANASWPLLGNITVLGWRAPVGNATVAVLGPQGPPGASSAAALLAAAAPGVNATVEEARPVVVGPPPAGGPSASSSSAQVNGTYAPGSLHFDLEGLRLPLRCGAGVLLTWQE